MEIAIIDENLRQVFSLFPAIVEEIRNNIESCSYCTGENGTVSVDKVTDAERKYTSRMSEILPLADEVMGYLQNYQGKIDDGSAVLDLMRSIVVYNNNRLNELNRVIKANSGESFIVRDKNLTKIFGMSFLEKTTSQNGKKLENLTYIFNPNLSFEKLVKTFDDSIAQGAKTHLELAIINIQMMAGKVSKKLDLETKNIANDVALIGTARLMRQYFQKITEEKDDYAVYQYFVYYYAAFARKLYANFWRYYVYNSQELNNLNSATLAKERKEITETKPSTKSSCNFSIDDPIVRKAIDICIYKDRFSTVMLQTYLGKNNEYMSQLVRWFEKHDLIGPQNGNLPREMIYKNFKDIEAKIERDGAKT